MKIRRSAASLALSCVVFAGLAVQMPGITQAKMLCGEQTHQKFGETRIYARDYIGTCRPDGSCAAVIYKLNAGTKKADAPLGWDHRLTLTRAKAGAAWQIVLTAVAVVPDISEGINLEIDRDGGNQVPYEFLQQGSAVNEVAIDTKLTDVLLEKLKPGNKMRWTYSVKGDDDKAATLFSLIGLTKAMNWIDCAQK